ncbi:DEAD/DEAH box helicase [Pelosinus fermentans]|uniref:DEAD/DEAH box helicase domain protein n=1 Tax=Pelosinus fermentans JBW45 TaxID=1192197 RepID=I9NSH7_9FIRM|nr:DEAD/DEAH box helicase [Pelosinus fermentans]AJQ28808.1 DEAD/DEAH box helicase domain protein [Pelosinus fermentans JBW45]
MQKDFTALGIRREIGAILAENGITKPTEIQVQAIPAIMSGKDVVGQSQTGTGKTLAFILPILEKIEISKPIVQALIITPTRELALQITREVAKLADQLGIQVLSVYGGQDVDRQIKKLKGGAQIVIGTPGRLMDHLRRETIQLENVTKLVLDEADQMLHMGFLEDVEELVRQTSNKRQTMLFSATMPSKIRGLADRYMRKPLDIRIQTKNITLDEIKQIMVEVPESEKIAKLSSMIDEYRPYLAIVFCHTKKRAIAVNMALSQKGYETDELHGELSQPKREQVMKRFREAKIQILVATDIAARGLDVEGVTHIFNYDIPHDVDSYIHRIGRTGRAGQAGMAITLIDPHEQPYVRLIEQGIRAAIEKHKVNDQKVVSTDKRRLFNAKGEEGKAGVEKKEKKRAFVFGKTDKKKTGNHSGANSRSRRKPKENEKGEQQVQPGREKRKNR